MLIDLTPASPWLTRHAHVFLLYRGASRVIAAIAYLGILIAPTVALSIPFQVLRALRIQPPAILYWLTATAILVLTFWLLYRFGNAGYHSLRHGVISLEAIFGFIGVALAVAFILWIMPTGWIPTPPPVSVQGASAV